MVAVQDSAMIITQLQSLLDEYERLVNVSAHDDLSDRPNESKVLVARLHAAFQRVVPSSSSYAIEAARLRGRPVHMAVNEIAALAYGLRDDMKAGWTSTLVELVHAETHADLVSMAQSLLSSGYKDAAAITIGTSLELHLKALTSGYDIEVADDKGRPRKADTIRSDLRRVDAFGPVQDKQIVYWLGVRNSAAHGSYADYDRSDVARMIEGIGAFIISNPA